MSVPRGFLTFGEPALSRDDIRAVVKVLQSGWIGAGPAVRQFEDAFARYKRVEHAVAVSSCTAALHLSLVTAGVGRGDEVITTPLTFCATINAIVHTGATPVLVDVDPHTMNIDARRIDAAVTSRTRAIVPVHFGGLPCDMAAIMRVAAAHGLVVIEDCAHAIEAARDGVPTGTAGDFGCFSFHATKNITTGEGGMVVTKSAEHAARVKALSLHGLSADAWTRYSAAGFRHYEVTAAGFKYNMTDIQAALGLSQLGRIEAGLSHRRALWMAYAEHLSALPLTLPVRPPAGVTHACHLFTVLVDPRRVGIDRDEFVRRMTAAGIGVGVHYRAIPSEPYYRDCFDWNPQDYPHADRIGRQTVSLPLSLRMTERDAARVARVVRAIVAGMTSRKLRGPSALYSRPPGVAS